MTTEERPGRFVTPSSHGIRTNDGVPHYSRLRLRPRNYNFPEQPTAMSDLFTPRSHEVSRTEEGRTSFRQEDSTRSKSTTPTRELEATEMNEHPPGEAQPLQESYPALQAPLDSKRGTSNDVPGRGEQENVRGTRFGERQESNGTGVDDFQELLATEGLHSSERATTGNESSDQTANKIREGTLLADFGGQRMVVDNEAECENLASLHEVLKEKANTLNRRQAERDALTRKKDILVTLQYITDNVGNTLLFAVVVIVLFIVWGLTMGDLKVVLLQFLQGPVKLDHSTSASEAYKPWHQIHTFEAAEGAV